jgi:simple sugar transport system ATP-binding protein
VVGTSKTQKVNEQKLAEMMVGREVNLIVLKKAANPTDVALQVKDLFVRDERGQSTVNGVSSGFILGSVGSCRRSG